MKKKLKKSLKMPLIAGTFILLGACGTTSKEDKQETTESEMPEIEKSETTKPVMDEAKCMAKSELRVEMRKLWEDHVTWTRNVILNIMDGLPGTDKAVARLLKNQDDIGDAIEPYYGKEAGDKLAALLHTHITQAADLLKAAKAKNNASFDKINAEWKVNADEISKFLADANPKWKYVELQEMMREHLKLTTDEAVARLNKDYDADIKAYDKVHEEILKMSDMLYMGITEQFAEKVK